MTDLYPEDPVDAPDWAFSPELDLRCPECNGAVRGINWIMSEPETEEVAPGVTMTPGPVVTGMDLVPCHDVLDAGMWELTFSGRDRKFGTIIRTPKFVQKKGRS